MRATNYKHYGSDNGKNSVVNSSKKVKNAKKFSVALGVFAVIAALIVPTTTLAPDVDAYENSKIASYSVGDINEFASVISDNCAELTTAPQTEKITSAESTAKATSASTESSEATEPTEAETKQVNKTEEPAEAEEEEAQTTSSSEYSNTSSTSSYLLNISNPDSSYSPSYVSLSDYDRAKLERLVMGEAGTMGYNGAALVAQSIRDAMNRSNTSSIDQIISEYQYSGSTSIEPNDDVLEAVSYIFDQNGSAVQHRLLCFYTGESEWHETQSFIIGYGSVRFFDIDE